MTVTQYTGLRYVPKFAEPEEWDSSNAYERLTVVLHEGNSYTSKQAVPKGVDISNKAYWSMSANYNAQVEQYRQEVLTFDTKINKNTQDIVNLSKPTVLVLGDSWTDSGSSSWVNKLKGYNVINYAVSGAAYIKSYSDISGTFMEQAIKSRDLLVDKIIVLGGLNDIRVNNSTPRDVGSAAYNLSSYLAEQHPNAKIFFGVNTPKNNEVYSHTIDFTTYIQTNVQVNGSSFINSQHWLNYFNVWKDDGIHPTEYGQNIIASNMQTVLEGGTPNTTFKLDTTNSELSKNIVAIGGEGFITINGYITPKSTAGQLFEVCYPDTTIQISSWANVICTVINEDYSTVGAVAFVNGVLHGTFPSSKLNTKFYINMTVPM